MKIIQNRKNVDFKDLDKVLKDFGYVCRQPKGGSSHYVYTKSGKAEIITVPKKKPVKEVYVRKIISILNLEEYCD